MLQCTAHGTHSNPFIENIKQRICSKKESETIFELDIIWSLRLTTWGWLCNACAVASEVFGIPASHDDIPKLVRIFSVDERKNRSIPHKLPLWSGRYCRWSKNPLSISWITRYRRGHPCILETRTLRSKAVKCCMWDTQHFKGDYWMPQTLIVPSADALNKLGPRTTTDRTSSYINMSEFYKPGHQIKWNTYRMCHYGPDELMLTYVNFISYRKLQSCLSNLTVSRSHIYGSDSS